MARTGTAIALVFVFGVLPICFGLPKAVRAQRGSVGAARSYQTQPQATSSSVSYTHLDVYKRQAPLFGSSVTAF